MTKKIKILALSYLFPNRNQPFHGVFVLNRLKALSKYVDIKVINPIPWSPAHQFLGRYKANADIPEKDIIGGLEVYHPRFFSIPRFFKAQEAGSYLRAITPVVDALHKEFDFDIVDMHWTFPDLPAGLAIAEKFNAKSMVTLRGMEAFHFQDADKRKSIVAKGLVDVDRIVALSNELKDIGDQLSKEPEKSIVISNGVDTDAFYYIERDKARRAIGMPADKDLKIILGVGSLIYRKGFDLVLEALPDLIKKHHNIKYYIVGSEGPEGDYRAELKAKITEKSLDDVVVFQGAVSNTSLVNWYNASDVFCLSSRREGSPNVLSEALACGTPAVSTAVGSAPEIMAMGSCSNLLLDDTGQLVTLLERAISSARPRLDSSDQYKKFDWSWCAKQVLPIYQELVFGEGSK